MKFKISELADFNSESIRKNDELDEIHYLDTANLTEGVFEEIKKYNWKEDKVPSRARRRVKENDILVSTVRPNQKHYGFITAKEQEYIVSTGFAVITPNTDKVDPYYLYQYLTLEKTTNYLQMIAENSTSAYPSIKPKDIGDLEIKLPTLNKQKQIGDFLWNINKKIHLNSSIISNLEELTQTLFKRWFVDFEFPNEEGKAYKSSGRKMIETELGMIPEGWEVKQLNEVVKHSKKSFNPNKEEQIRVAHFSLPAYDSQQYPIFEDSKTIKSNKYYIDKNSVMFSRMNPKTPRTWLPNIQNKYINVCSSEYVVLDTSLYANKGYTFSLITSNDFNNYLINNATGSTNSRQRVRPEVSLKYTFAHNEDITKEFEQKVGSFYREIINLREEIFTLSNLRDTFLPKLLSGEIDLKDVEIK